MRRRRELLWTLAGAGVAAAWPAMTFTFAHAAGPRIGIEKSAEVERRPEGDGGVSSPERTGRAPAFEGTPPPEPGPSGAQPNAARPAPATSGSREAPKQRTPPSASVSESGADTADLRALREAERELFGKLPPPPEDALRDFLSLPFNPGTGAVDPSGLPRSPATPGEGPHKRDLAFLSRLDLPSELPVRWDARVVRFLEFWRSDPRGRALMANWVRRSGRYRETVQSALRRKGLPEDLLALALVESGFEPQARSPVGALGLWQFMPETARLYGLTVDRWLDQRLDVSEATEAAADHLADLHRRFGSWELAMAAYNMGYGGLVNSIRRYNTNDFWVLSRLEGALPWETSLYVPKIIAAAIVLKNPSAFGYRESELDAPLVGDLVAVLPGTTLGQVATAAGCDRREIELLNSQFRAGKAPPAILGGPKMFAVRVPAGRGAATSEKLLKKGAGPGLTPYVVRQGDTLEGLAGARHLDPRRIASVNALSSNEIIRPGRILFLPSEASARVDSFTSSASTEMPLVAVPGESFAYADRRRVFYGVVAGDTLAQIAHTFGVAVDDVRRWNTLDPSARLHEGMTLQIYVRPETKLEGVATIDESRVRPVTAGSEEFVAYWEGLKGKRRVVVEAKDGDTLATIGRRHGVSPGMMERANRRSRRETLKGGESVIVYLPPPGQEVARAKGRVAAVSAGMARNRTKTPGPSRSPEKAPSEKATLQDSSTPSPGTRSGPTPSTPGTTQGGAHGAH